LHDHVRRGREDLLQKRRRLSLPILTRCARHGIATVEWSGQDVDVRSVASRRGCGGQRGCLRVPGQQRRCCRSRCTPKSRRDLRTHRDGKRSRSSSRSSTLALFAQRPEGLLAVDRFHPTALEIV
jgi:hypothetical protein